MSIDLVVAASPVVSVLSRAPTLAFPDQVVLEITSGEIFIAAGSVKFGLVEIGLGVSGGQWAISAIPPKLQVYPVKLSVAGIEVNPTSDSPSLTLGYLPKGLVLVDNEDNTADIYGTPVPGTAGIYLIPLKAVNNIPPSAEQTFRLEIKLEAGE